MSVNMPNFINVPTRSTIDMLRIGLRYRGANEKAGKTFDAIATHMQAMFRGTEERRQETANGRYRERIVVPVGDSSITMGYGLNIGGKCHYENGFIEFNPAKTYPSKELEFLYYLLTREPLMLMETKRWDYAVDVPFERTRLALVKDKRMYQCIQSGSLTEYLGRRNKGGFVKLYDRREVIRRQGGEQDLPLSRVEITIGEPGATAPDRDDRDIIADVWPKIVCVPDKMPGVNGGKLMLLMLAWTNGVALETALDCCSKNTRAKYRRAITERCGLLLPPDDFGECRRGALAWANGYGGIARL